MTARVVVDGWELSPPEQRRGIGRFLDGVLPALAAEPMVDVTVLQPADEVGRVELPRGTTSRPVHRLVPRGRVRAGIGEHVARLPFELARTPHDVAWAPGTLPFVHAPGPWVQTLHDLAPLVLDLPGYGFHRAQWRLLGRRLRRAERVVAVSRFAADEGIRVLGLDPRRVEVVPHGVDAAFRPDGPRDEVDEPYVAAVASDDPRKGLPDLVRVAAHLAGRGTRLHVAGPLGSAARARLESAGATCRGHVADLPAFLRSARVVVVTSRYEGFGFVPLEAMACGTPVVAYDTSAVSEVVGAAGRLVATADVAALCAEVEAVLDDPARHDHLRADGLARARTFRWEAAAAEYARLLRAVV